LIKFNEKGFLGKSKCTAFQKKRKIVGHVMCDMLFCYLALEDGRGADYCIAFLKVIIQIT
jgi:hypothetical protein